MTPNNKRWSIVKTEFLEESAFLKALLLLDVRPPVLIVNDMCPIKLLIVGGRTLSIERNVHDCSHVGDTVGH